MTRESFEWRTAEPPRSGWTSMLAGAVFLAGLGAVYIYAAPYFASRTIAFPETAAKSSRAPVSQSPEPGNPNVAVRSEPSVSDAAARPASPKSPERPALVEARPPEKAPPVPAVVLNKGADKQTSRQEPEGRAGAENADRFSRAPVESARERRAEPAERTDATRGYRRARVEDRRPRFRDGRSARERAEDEPTRSDVDVEDYQTLRADVLRRSLRSPD